MKEELQKLHNKDWTGNSKSTFTTLGASSHSLEDREENDFYATDPLAMELLLEKETFNKNIWECAVGNGMLSNVLKSHGYNVKETDLYDRGCGESGVDFLTQTEMFGGDIITNPPFKYNLLFVKKALELIPQGNRVAMFLRIQFLEGKERGKFFKHSPPKIVYVASGRLSCAKNSDFEKYKSSATAYAWFIWEKGYKGDTIIKWIN